ncbi:hypothetical protein [Priestia megaterium]|uniref:hypothetical protein n=1 Tax=Priestia megaterium TaxID=1404 RepID=UPI0011B7AAE2|nr:hypothetical protein [Priestia megaterium]QDZ88741.1 hypothetical protein D0441_31415 [Priestia megaterium]
MANLMTSYIKQEILAELRKGNTELLKGLPPVVSISMGLALQQEAGEVEEASPINHEAVNEAISNRLRDTGIKAQIIKQMERTESK